MVSSKKLLGGVSLLFSVPMSIYLSSSQVLAADLPVSSLPVIQAQVEMWNPWMVRVRAIGVTTQESVKFDFDGVRTAGDINASMAAMPELDISYFFTKNIAAELTLTSTPHRIKGSEELLGVGKIGRAWILPPTLTLQYHFDLNDSFKPYVGAGVNYAFFHNEKAKDDFTKFELKDRAGFALQAGFDVMLNKHWGVNFDVKKIFLKTEVDAVHGTDTDVSGTMVPAVKVTGDVRLDPWIVGTGVTYKF